MYMYFKEAIVIYFVKIIYTYIKLITRIIGAYYFKYTDNTRYII